MSTETDRTTETKAQVEKAAWTKPEIVDFKPVTVAEGAGGGLTDGAANQS